MSPCSTKSTPSLPCSGRDDVACGPNSDGLTGSSGLGAHVSCRAYVSALLELTGRSEVKNVARPMTFWVQGKFDD